MLNAAARSQYDQFINPLREDFEVHLRSQYCWRMTDPGHRMSQRLRGP